MGNTFHELTEEVDQTPWADENTLYAQAKDVIKSFKKRFMNIFTKNVTKTV